MATFFNLTRSLLTREQAGMSWTKDTVVTKLYLARIHFLIIKLFIVKGFTYAIIKILH